MGAAAGSSAVLGAVFFLWLDFGTGLGRPASIGSRGRTVPLLDGLSAIRRGFLSQSGTVGGGSLFSLSAGGIFPWLCISWCVVSSAYKRSLWLFPVLFRLLFYSDLWAGRGFAGAGGVWSALCGNAALLFFAGGSGLGAFRFSGEFVLWERTTDRSGGLWSRVVVGARGGFCRSAGRNRCGAAAFALVSSADFRAYSFISVIEKRERGSPRIILNVMESI